MISRSLSTRALSTATVSPGSTVWGDRGGGYVTRLLLNRPKVLNSLDADMCIDVGRKLAEWRTNKRSGVLLVKGEGGKAFCAGGDVKGIQQEISKPAAGGRDLSAADRFFRNEYSMNYLLGCGSPNLSQISIWDGIVMGGGVGISIYGDFRVATERTVFSMPETAIGIFPDVGGSYWLPRLPGFPGFGLYIGLTGCRLGAADLLRSGIATHFVPSGQIAALESDLEDTFAKRFNPSHTPRSSPLPSAAQQLVAEVLSRHTVDLLSTSTSSSSSSNPPSILPAHADSITRCFGSDASSSVEAIVAALEREAGGGSDKSAQWAAETLTTLKRQSPTSLKLTLAQLTRGARLLGLKDCLRMEFRMIMQCMADGDGDFVEGIRAVLVDKDNRPRWKPDTLEGVSDDKIARYFRSLGDGDLDLDRFDA